MFTDCIRYSLVLVIASVPMTLPPDTEPEASETPAAVIVNDEGGPVTVRGSVAYTDTFFLAGVAEPLIILEDQAGFVDRDRSFLMPEESQVLGQITSDFFTSPFSYSVSLPIEPEASLRDVDHDAEAEAGVMVYAVAYWTNTWGDAYLEQRDLFGGGWSTVYASTLIDPDPSAEGEVIGGTYLVYSPDDQQGFPSGFGDDGLLFTDDDPIVTLPQGYTVVNMDTSSFTFDRSREVVIDLIEGEQAAANDFSGLTYTEAFDAMVELFRTEYAFTEYKGLDWDAISAEFRPWFVDAEANNDPIAYQLALRDFTWSIPDGHVFASTEGLGELFDTETGGGLGLAIREVDDGRIIASFVLADGPAAVAGIEERAEILEINGRPTGDVVSETVPWSSPFSTDHVRRLQQLRYALRFPVDTSVDVTFQNPGGGEPVTAPLVAVVESESFSFSSFSAGLTGTELPVEFTILDNGYGVVTIYSFFDNTLLTIQLWERMIQLLNDNEIPGLIIDMRHNDGGSAFLADQMPAYFFDEALTLGNTGFYDPDAADFYFDPRSEGVFYLPPENLRYRGPIAVLVGPSCGSACETFSYNLTLEDRATVVGQYPTAGLGGSVEQFLMPDAQLVQFTNGRGVNDEGEIHIEGIGVVPTIRVPVDEDTLFSDGDPILDAAVREFDAATAVEIVDGGAIAIGDTVTGDLAVNSRVQYTLETVTGDSFGIVLGDESGQFDTYLRLYDSEGTLIAENDDASETTFNSALLDLVAPEDNTLVIEVATFDDASEGPYTLQVVASEADPPGGSAAPTDVSASPTGGSEAPADVPETTAS